MEAQQPTSPLPCISGSLHCHAYYPYVIADGGPTINQLIRTYINESANTVRSTSSAAVNHQELTQLITDSKSFNVKIKGPGASTYTNITAKNSRTNSELLFQEQLTVEFCRLSRNNRLRKSKWTRSLHRCRYCLIRSGIK
jgi:hypothetical protein